MKAERGFTLIELMITIVVLAIIVSIAYPSYMEQTRKARRSDGTSALSKASMMMESCRANLATFTGCVPDANSEEGYYGIGVAVAVDGLSYTLTATAQGVQLKDDKCDTITLTSAGTKGHTGTAGDAATCWGG